MKLDPKLNFTRFEKKLMKLAFTDYNITDAELAEKLHSTKDEVRKVRNRLGRRVIKYVESEKKLLKQCLTK